MTLLENYLSAVAAQLTHEERADIIAELQDVILSRFEDREAELGRNLTDEEQEAILHEIGHPLVVAARYRKGPDSLVGPELFPYWLFGMKVGLIVLAVIQAIGLILGLKGGPANFGQDIAQAFHGFFIGGLTLMGALTLGAAIMEHYQIRPRWITHWRAQDLPAFGFADLGAWGAALGGTADPKARGVQRSPKKPTGWPGAEPLMSLIGGVIFVMWWTGAFNVPTLSDMTFDGAGLSAAPIWGQLWGFILFWALFGIAADVVSLIWLHHRRLRAALNMVSTIGWIVTVYLIFQAGHWFTLAVDGRSAQVGGGWELFSREAWDAFSARGDVSASATGDGLQRAADWLSLTVGWGLGGAIVVMLLIAAGYGWTLLRGEAKSDRGL